MHLRMLLSYHYFKDVELRALLARHFAPPYPEIFADSGAYSAHTQGVRLDVDAYADWLLRYRDLFCCYANLDDLGDWRRTRHNQEMLEARGLDPLPVFHAGEPLAVLRDLVARYPYIGLGGLVGKATRPATRAFLSCAFGLARGRAVYHGFGLTTWALLRDFPWYSVDSSTWGAGYRYGVVPLFDDQTGRWHKLALGQPAGRLALVLRRYGFAAADFTDRTRNERAKIAALSAVSYMRAETYLRRRWGPITLPDVRAGRAAAARDHDNPHSAGLRTFLVDSALGMNRLRDAASGLKVYLADNELPNTLVRADQGLKLYLADANSTRLRHAEGGLKLYLADARPQQPDVGLAQGGLPCA